MHFFKKLLPQKRHNNKIFLKIALLKNTFQKISPSKNTFQEIAILKLNLRSLKIKSFSYFFSHFLFVQRELLENKQIRNK